MTLTGANNFSENNDYTVYTVNSNQNGQYSLILPKNTDGEVSMIVDMNMKTDFDALVSNTITKESLLEKLDKEYKKVKETNPYGILVFPMIDTTNLTNAMNNNDKQKIVDETKKFGGITSELYKNLTDSGLDKSKINQKIMIIEKNETDSKFVDWLKGQMPDFIDGMKYETEIKEEKAPESTPIEETVTEKVAPQPEPVVTNDIPSETSLPTEEPTIPGDIFNEPTPAVEQPVTENPTPQQESTIPGDIFSEPTPAVEQPVTENIVQQPEQPIPSEPVQAVEAPTETPVTENVIPQVEPSPTPDIEPQLEQIKEPQPINSVSLDATQTIQPVENSAPENIPQPEVQASQQVNNIDKKSGGFANILILLVILAVVTVGSIELGKILFNTFGT